MPMFHAWYIYAHTSPIYVIIRLAYMPNLVCIFVSGTYLAITNDAKVAVGCVLANMCINVGPHAHLTCWACGYIWNVVAIFVQ